MISRTTFCSAGRRPPPEVQETHRRSTGGTCVISLAPRWKVT